jgi:hypothetical protein
LKSSADRLGEQNVIVHDQDANRCSSFPSTGNSIWKIVGKPYGEVTRLDLPALAPERTTLLIFLLLSRRRTERTVTQLEPHPQDEGHLAARRPQLVRLVRTSPTDGAVSHGGRRADGEPRVARATTRERTPPLFGSTETTTRAHGGRRHLSTGAAVSPETWRSGFDASWSTASWSTPAATKSWHVSGHNRWAASSRRERGRVLH